MSHWVTERASVNMTKQNAKLSHQRAVVCNNLLICDFQIHDNKTQSIEIGSYIAAYFYNKVSLLIISQPQFKVQVPKVIGD